MRAGREILGSPPPRPFHRGFSRFSMVLSGTRTPPGNFLDFLEEPAGNSRAAKLRGNKEARCLGNGDSLREFSSREQGLTSLAFRPDSPVVELPP
ncbi:hypothetical protein KM043_006506 [Ampulex compressa]|nr:hypothetical protein KM043_006506 [Ampulex compressa]